MCEKRRKIVVKMTGKKALHTKQSPFVFAVVRLNTKILTTNSPVAEHNPRRLCAACSSSADGNKTRSTRNWRAALFVMCFKLVLLLQHLAWTVTWACLWLMELLTHANRYDMFAWISLNHIYIYIYLVWIHINHCVVWQNKASSGATWNVLQLHGIFFPRVLLEKATKKMFKKWRHVQKKLKNTPEGDWTNVMSVIFWMDQSDFFSTSGASW